MSDTCIFCEKNFPEESGIFFENNAYYSKWEKYPVSPGHVLIVSQRHAGSIFDLTSDEFSQMQEAIIQAKKIVDKKYEPDGYNIGINDGKAAGQTIPHLHIHLIPRYNGDINNPIGGVRNIIPEKGDYTKIHAQI